MNKIKRCIGNKGVAVALALVMVCMNSSSVMAMSTQRDSYTYEIKMYSECADEFASASCWNCGNYSFYQTIENGPWKVFSQVQCQHGLMHDIIEISDVYSYVKCTYCHWVHQQTYLRTDSIGPYCR